MVNYLGTVLTEYNIINIDIAQRKVLPNKTRYGFKNQLNTPDLKCHTNCMFYKTLKISIITYGIE